jgi:hypothetical protein
VEVVHLVIEIRGGRMAGGALRFAKEQFLARDFAGRGWASRLGAPLS